MLADDQRVDIVRAFAGDVRFQIHHGSHDWVVFGDAVGAWK